MRKYYVELAYRNGLGMNYSHISHKHKFSLNFVLFIWKSSQMLQFQRAEGSRQFYREASSLGGVGKGNREYSTLEV